MSHEQAYLGPTSPTPIMHDVSSGAPLAQEPIELPTDGVVMPLERNSSGVDIIEDATGYADGNIKTPTIENSWQAASLRLDIDTLRVRVSTSDASQIMANKSATPPMRTAQVARNAIAKLAELAGIDEADIPSAVSLEEAYYHPAAYMFSNQKTSVEVAVILDMIDEALAPYIHATPVPIAERYAHMLHHRSEGYVGVLITKLWAADVYDIDLPRAYEAIKAAKVAPSKVQAQDFHY